ncbi:MAG: hypothetical protein OXU23_05005 [Candidatus Poribacteria bacterium]|nr:hypothetical protein [Candidatus Poribacteria bacterium]
MKDTLTICKTFLIGCIVLCLFIVGCEVKDQREPLTESPADRQSPEARKNVDTQRSTVKPVPPADIEQTNALSKEEMDKATRIKKWLKEQNYTVFPYGIQPSNGGGAYALGVGSSSHVDKVTLTNMGSNKVRISITGVGSAVFIFDANGELQPAK